jgi:hypothetical protein
MPYCIPSYRGGPKLLRLTSDSTESGTTEPHKRTPLSTIPYLVAHASADFP